MIWSWWRLLQVIITWRHRMKGKSSSSPWQGKWNVAHHLQALNGFQAQLTDQSQSYVPAYIHQSGRCILYMPGRRKERDRKSHVLYIYQINYFSWSSMGKENWMQMLAEIVSALMTMRSPQADMNTGLTWVMESIVRWVIKTLGLIPLNILSIVLTHLF